MDLLAVRYRARAPGRLEGCEAGCHVLDRIWRRRWGRSAVDVHRYVPSIGIGILSLCALYKTIRL